MWPRNWVSTLVPFVGLLNDFFDARINKAIVSPGKHAEVFVNLFARALEMQMVARTLAVLIEPQRSKTLRCPHWHLSAGAS